MFFFRVMAPWFGRFPFPCPEVVGVFPKILVRVFKLTVTNNKVLYSLSFRYRSTAIVHERYHARYLPRLSYEYCVKFLEKFV